MARRAGENRLRVMQPIRAGGLCLACHGPRETIEAETLARIDALYPQDAATGYAAGDLRGAFSASILLPEEDRSMQPLVEDPDR